MNIHTSFSESESDSFYQDEDHNDGYDSAYDSTYDSASEN